MVVDQSTPAADNAQDAPDRRGGTSEGAQNSGDNGQADVPPANVPPVNDNANVNARGNGG